MGRSGWAIAFALILFFAGCLEANTTKVENLCCARVVDGECVDLGNTTTDPLSPGFSVLSGGQCSLSSQVCYNVEIELPSGDQGNVTLPMCKYASQGYCNVSYTFLSYQKFYPKKDVNYDAAVQLFMFNNSTTTDYTPPAEKSPIKLLYAKPYVDVLPVLDLRKVNIYGIKYGVGRSFKQFHQYRNFFPFDYSYSGQNLYNPYFYVLSNKSVDICEYNEAGNNYTCGGRTFRTYESCLLFCEMPDYSKPAIWDMRRFDLFVNKSLGYMWFYRNVSFWDEGWNPVEVDITGAMISRIILQQTNLPSFFNRYEVGLFKRFADGPAPNMFGTFNASQLTFKGYEGGLFLGEIIRIGSRSWVTLKDDNYTMRVINYSISVKPIAANKLKNIDFGNSPIQGTLDTKSKYYLINYYSEIELDINATVRHEFCFFICFGTGGKDYNPLRILFKNNVTEIIAEEKLPLTYISQILPYAYYNRFFPNTSIHHKFPRLTSKGIFANFTGLPYECIIEDEVEYCDNTYYERYACVDKDTGEDIECGCTSEGCFAINGSYITDSNHKVVNTQFELQDPYYNIIYRMDWQKTPTLKFQDGWKARPAINLTDTENWTNYREYFSFSSRNIETSFGKALAIPQSAIELATYDGEDLKILGCFEDYGGSDAVVICRSGNQTTTGFTSSINSYLLRGSISPSAFCGEIMGNPELFNKSFVRYPSDLNDTAYFFSVAFVVDVDGDNAFGRCNITKDSNGNWGIAVRSYGLPSPGKSSLTSAVQFITWAETFNYTGSDRDDVVPAKMACGYDDPNYRTISYDFYRRVKGCYSGKVVNESEIIGPALTKDKNIVANYSYGFWNHLPNTEEELKQLLIQGVQPIIFLDDDVPPEYYTKLLRDVDNFILVDSAVVYPFIQYTDFPIGSVIVVAKNDAQKQNIKKACETCFAVTPINMTVSPAGASFTGYNPQDNAYCNRPTLGIYTCAGISTVDCSGEDWWDQEIMFFGVSFSGISSLSNAYAALENMLQLLDRSARYSGKPAFLYIYDVTPVNGMRYLMMAMANMSSNLSAAGVMGVHFEDFDSYLEYPGSLVYEANELGRGLRASTIKSIQEVRLNRSQCSFVVSESSAPLTCINNTYPVMRGPGTNPLETENLEITPRNFLQNSLKIALANFLSGQYICNTAPDPETGETIYYTFLPSITYFKGTMPVLFHEVYGSNKSFPLQPYKYSDLNAKQCAPQTCTFKVKTVCEPVTCYELKEYYHNPGTITVNVRYPRVQDEYPLSADYCELNVRSFTLSGFGSLSYRYDPLYYGSFMKVSRDGCDTSKSYQSANYGNFTMITTVGGNCSTVTSKTLISNNTIIENRQTYLIDLLEVSCTSSSGFGDSWCGCVVNRKTVNSSAGSATVEDDECNWSGGDVYAAQSTRTITFPREIVTYARFNETYQGQLCYDQVYLDCS